jgi:hypothetical protein
VALLWAGVGLNKVRVLVADVDNDVFTVFAGYLTPSELGYVVFNGF